MPPPQGWQGMPPGTGMPPKRNPGKRLLISVVIIVGLIIVGAISSKLSDSTDNAKVGDCVKDAPTDTTVKGDNMKKVKCSDPTAKYKVVGKVDHVSRISVSLGNSMGNSVCRAYPTATGTYWRGKDTGMDGYVLCLAPNQP